VVKILFKLIWYDRENDLTAAGKRVGLILNFGTEKVEVKRKVRTLDQLDQ